jgi:hypothetical protein
MKLEQIPAETGPSPEKAERMLAKEERALAEVGKSFRLSGIFKMISRLVAATLGLFKK